MRHQNPHRTLAFVCAMFFLMTLMFMASLGARQDPPKPATNGAAAVTTAAPTLAPKWTQELTDLEDLANTKSALFQTRVKALQAEVNASQKEVGEVVTRATKALVEACGKTTDTHDYDYNKRLCFEKPKEPEKK